MQDALCLAALGQWSNYARNIQMNLLCVEYQNINDSKNILFATSISDCIFCMKTPNKIYLKYYAVIALCKSCINYIHMNISFSLFTFVKQC